MVLLQLKRMININELSDIINIKPQTIRNRLSYGTFPISPKKIGGSLRWDLRDVNRYIDNLKPLRRLPE